MYRRGVRLALGLLMPAEAVSFLASTDRFTTFRSFAAMNSEANCVDRIELMQAAMPT